ncbi:MAG: spore germination protein, partial [Negativicutes bacterium]|nr:spore germination protein [Negativicutes bacterium]
MAKQKKIHIKKLSDINPAEALNRLNKGLVTLRRLTTKGAELGEDIAQIVAKLRQVAAPDNEPFVFTQSLQENEQLLQVVLRDCDDVKWRYFKAGKVDAFVVFLLGMVDTTLIEKNVLETLMGDSNNMNVTTSIQSKYNQLLTSASLARIAEPAEAFEALMTGSALVFIDGVAEAFAIGAVKHVKRDISVPQAEDVIRGPHDAFNETLMDNLTMLRRKTHDTNLKVSMLRLGDRSRTAVALVYIADLIKPGLLEEVNRRLAKINTDIILLSYKIEELITDHPWSPFPQVQSTERPDKVISSIYEGRMAIVVDNTPMALIVPCTYNALMQSPEDYTSPAVVAGLITLTRHFCGFIAIYLPAIYISIVSFHPGMLPTTLAISIAELRSRTP